MIYRKYSKCGGCACLKQSKDKKEYYCSLSHKIKYLFDESNNISMQPKPEEACYKPKNAVELKEIASRHYNGK